MNTQSNPDSYRDKKLQSKIYLIGYMASGKTHFGKNLAGILHYNFIDLDDLIEKEEGATITEIFQTKGEAYFRSVEKDMLHQTMFLDNTIISCGGGTPCFFDNIQFIKENGLSIWLNPPVELILNRIKNAPNTRPILNGLEEAALRNKIETQLKERAFFYSQAIFSYDSSEMKEADFIAFVQKLIKG